MGQNRMLGVVLWCDSAQAKAVIWCEDHGKLAYYTPRDVSMHEGDPCGALDAGDLVRFDLSEQDQLRFAHNPEVLTALSHPYLAEALEESHTQQIQTPGDTLFEPASRPAPANSDTVIDFTQVMSERIRATA